MKQLVLKLLRIYQKSYLFRSNLFKQLYLSDSSCRFSPTCSDYTYQAVEKYGAIKGICIGILRIIRCHPFSRGGYDPIP